MTQELFYTSAPRGLVAGSEGFSTVSATRGLSSSWREALEGICAYRPLFPPDDPRNPITHAHLRLTVGGRTQSVLARIGPAGLDYTGRPNKFGHFLVVEPRECPSAGPAWLLSRPRLLESKWDGNVGWRESAPRLPEGDVQPRVCANWERLTGDAGWAGVLAESFLQRPDQPVVLLFEPGTDVLPLFDEALALLPVNRRWAVTFSTYFTSLPPTANCAWRAMVAGTPEAKSAMRLPGVFVLDLTKHLAQAAGRQFVDAARTGQWNTEFEVDDSAGLPEAPVYRVSARTNDLTRTPNEFVHEPEWPAPVANSGFDNSSNRDTQSRPGRLVTWLMVLGLLGGAATFAVFLLLRPAKPSDESKAVAASTKEAAVTASDLKPKPEELTVKQKAQIKEWSDRVFADLAERAIAVASSWKPVPIKDGTPILQAHSPGESPKPSDSHSVIQVDLNTYRIAAAGGALPRDQGEIVDLTRNFGPEELDGLTMEFRPATTSAFQPTTQGKSLLLVARVPRVGADLELLDFVIFSLQGSKVHCQLLNQATNRNDSNRWIDLFDSHLVITTPRTNRSVSIAFRREQIGSIAAKSSPRAGGSGATQSDYYFQIDWGLTLAPRGQLNIRNAIVRKDTDVTVKYQYYDEPTKKHKNDEWSLTVSRVFRPKNPNESGKAITLGPDLADLDNILDKALRIKHKQFDITSYSVDETLSLKLDSPSKLTIGSSRTSPLKSQDVEVEHLELCQTIGAKENSVFRHDRLAGSRILPRRETSR